MPCTVDITIEQITADINQATETVVLTVQDSPCVGGGGLTGGGHTIQEDGVSLPQRANLNFEGVSVVDDVINDATKIILNRNVDGGSASSVYLPTQVVNGGTA